MLDSIVGLLFSLLMPEQWLYLIAFVFLIIFMLSVFAIILYPNLITKNNL